MTRTAQVVIIGGGVNGCSTAFNLARRGVRDVVLLEREHVASGPTGLSSGVVRQFYTHEPLAAMARDSVRVLATFREETGGDAGFVQCGVVFFCGAGENAVFFESVAMHQRIGINERLLSGAELGAMEPRLRVDDIAFGAYEPDGGYADPAMVANSYAAAAERLGVRIERMTEVTAIDLAGGRVVGVRTSKEPIATECVLNIAGPWGGRVLAMVGVDVPLTASRHPVLVLDRPPEWREPTPVWGDLISGWYFKPEGKHGMMIGSLTEVEADKNVDIGAYSQKLRYEETVPYSEAILNRLPVMEDGTVTASWAGLYDVTPDGMPLIGAVPGVSGLYSAIGFSGHGFKTAPAIGNVMADFATTGRSDRYDLSLFRYERFEERALSPSRSAFQIIG